MIAYKRQDGMLLRLPDDEYESPALWAAHMFVFDHVPAAVAEYGRLKAEILAEA
ncbi:hypothetical protein ACIHFD_13955 [Nonomuraea sp. NPDC051941]|uniref:hypothetical protein n=1 Tax=Nonomuraea sp. NPDC051941 TaxID=3364373 RepID=UPI0037CCBAC3